MQLDLKRITLVCQGRGGLLGLPLATEMTDRFERLVIMNTGLPISGKPLVRPSWPGGPLPRAAEDMDVGGVLERATVSQLPAEVVSAYDAPFARCHVQGRHRHVSHAGSRRRCRRALPQCARPPRGCKLANRHGHVCRPGSRDRRRRPVLSAIDPHCRRQARDHDSRRGPFLQEDKGEEIAEPDRGLHSPPTESVGSSSPTRRTSPINQNTQPTTYERTVCHERACLLL